MLEDTARSEWRAYAIAAAAFGAFFVYGSLFPFELRLQSLDDPGAVIAAAQAARKVGVSRTDVVANVLLSVPLGFCLFGAFRARADRARGVLRSVVAAFAVVFALSIAVESAQILVSGRTPSEYDVLAQFIGCACGIVLWPVLAPGLRALRGDLPGGISRVERALLLYGALFVATQLLPLDVTITPHELAEKYRAGLIRINPFDTGASWDSSVDVVVKIMLYAPIGVLTTLAAIRTGYRWSVLIGWAAGMGMVLVLEVAQIVIRSRRADAADVVIGSGVIAAAAVLTTRADRRKLLQPQAGAERHSQRWAAAGLSVWVLALAAYHWFPFNFHVDSATVRDRLPYLFGLPFAAYFSGSDTAAVGQALNKLALALPFGMLLSGVVPSSSDAGVRRLRAAVLLTIIVLTFAAIEGGQLFLPARFPDGGDIVIGSAGAAIGLRLLRPETTTSEHTRMVRSRAGGRTSQLR